MGAGCVVIVPNIKNNLEIVKHNQTGILYDKHSDDLKKIINSVSENKELLKKISRNARAQILKNNSLSKVVEFEIDIYNQILEKS
jgi:glycosyltransferase involved in cell wall biosynthesis